MDELCGYGRLYSAMVSTNSIITGTNMLILLYTTSKISKDTIATYKHLHSLSYIGKHLVSL